MSTKITAYRRYCQLCQPMAKSEEFKRKALFEDYQRVELSKTYKKDGIRVYIVLNEISDLYELHVRYAKIKVVRTSRIIGNFERVAEDLDILKNLIIQQMVINQNKGVR